ncbi:MAG: sulfite exporter TauE/SafE family protein [Candidatus Latescibacterota bacterium]
MDGQTAVWVNLIIAASALVSSLTGFGYALVATPFLVLVFEPRLAVPVIAISWVPLAVLLSWEARAQMQPARIATWGLGALLGVPLGVWGLARLDGGLMRAVIGGLTLVAALTLWLKPARPLRRERPVAVLTGIVSGALGGATGMSGPPVILFGLNQGWPHAALRANLIGYFATKHVLALVMLREFGILDRTALLLGAGSLPGMLAGYAVGMRLKDRVSQKAFRILAFVLVLLGGLLALVKH